MGTLTITAPVYREDSRIAEIEVVVTAEITGPGSIDRCECKHHWASHRAGQKECRYSHYCPCLSYRPTS